MFAVKDAWHDDCQLHMIIRHKNRNPHGCKDCSSGTKQTGGVIVVFFGSVLFSSLGVIGRRPCTCGTNHDEKWTQLWNCHKHPEIVVWPTILYSIRIWIVDALVLKRAERTGNRDGHHGQSTSNQSQYNRRYCCPKCKSSWSNGWSSAHDVDSFIFLWCGCSLVLFCLLLFVHSCFKAWSLKNEKAGRWFALIVTRVRLTWLKIYSRICTAWQSWHQSSVRLRIAVAIQLHRRRERGCYPSFLAKNVEIGGVPL